MIINRIQCEICENHFRKDPGSRPYDVPPGWLVVFMDSPRFSEGYHFCSMQHLNQWTAKPTADCLTATIECQYGDALFRGTVYEVSE